MLALVDVHRFHPNPLRPSPSPRPHLEMLRVWRLRFEHDIAPDLMRFVQHERFDVRYQAALLLSYLEHAGAEEPLRALLEQPSEADRAELDRSHRRLRLEIALARIRARDLRGEAKVESIAASIGHNLDTLAPPGPFAMVTGGILTHEVIRQEVFELLYGMGRKGEDIEPLRSRLHLFGPNLLLKTASLPLAEEVTRVLDFMEKPGGMGYLSDSYLPCVGRNGLDLLLARLQDMLGHPERHFRSIPAPPHHIQYAERKEREAAERGEKVDLSYIKRPHYALGYSSLFHAASLSDDARFLPVLKQLEEKFQDDPDTRVRESARSAQEMLQRRLQILQSPDEESSPPS